VGEAASAWSAGAPDDEGRNSHLFLVNGAIEALGRQPSDPTAVHAWERFRLPVCRRAWQNGLFDADHKATFNGGRKDLFPGDSPWRIFRAGARFESHFYHPITQRNWRGKAMPTAKSEAEIHAQQAVHWFSQWDLGRGCYEAGLSLHFMTDIAQPMHAALFTALTPPLGLHSNLENEVDVFKDAYRIKAWGLPSPLPLPDLLQDIALESLAQWGPIRQAISEAYRGRCFPMSWHLFDAPRCWKGDPTVEALAGASLQMAQRRTAQYLHALERATELYRDENRAPTVVSTVVSTGAETATEATGILEPSSDESGFFRLVRASEGEEGLPSQ
jgi:phospholipase C